MTTLIQGYEYDIFISYRHNDNRSGWVTEFVNALQEELAATIKEPLYIYFDKNPHDGLLETHHVDKSLEGKLKCLIFIPIISQTYCDTKSFAWQHEFCAFNKLSKDDQFGMDIKLSNGNVASRILPIKIHNIDAEDKAVIETEIGGALRAIEFIYKEAGVNRPLKPTDSKTDNQNKTDYRNQVNKVANAVKENIAALKNPITQASRITNNDQPITTPPKNKKVLIAVSALLLLVIISYFLYQQRTTTNQQPAELDKSIAVLPFTDISDTKDQAYYSDGMMIEILDHLFKIKDLRIIPRNSTLSYKDSNKSLKTIAQELGVVHLIQGSVRKFGNRIKISVQLTNGLTEQNLWQETYEEDITDVSRLFSIQSKVAQKIASELKVQINPEVMKRIEAVPTHNQEAYDLYLKGREEASGFWSDSNTSHVQAGIAYLNKAISLDSTFSDAFNALGWCYWQLAEYAPDYSPDYYRQSREYLNKAIALDPQNGRAYSTLAVNQYHHDWDRKAASRSLKKAKELNPSDNEINMIHFWFYLHTQHCDSMKVMLDKMKEANPGDYYYEEVQLAICRGQDQELNAFYPPEGPSIWVGQLFEQQRLMILGKFDDALAKMELYKTLASEQIYLEMKGELLGMIGRKSEALQVIQELEALSKTQHVWPSRFAIIYMAMGDEKKAYEYLEKGLVYRGLWLHFVPYYAPFYKKRNDPKFQAFMKRTWVN